jgi:DtxR family Mn-dependent transcriptional regulator
MAAALEFPRHDPHGAPIPTSTGDIESTGPATLADARPGERVRIRAVRDEHSANLRSMAAEGLVPGARVLVTEEQSVAGAVEISLDAEGVESRSVQDDLARQIYVVPDEG